MPVYFYNQGNLDLETIRTMGVSVKVNDSPIGYFGTGLKYAIATLLRTEHRVTLFSNGMYYKFDSRPFEIRNQMFDCVFMNEEKLPFTTDLGRNWEPWMAFRELASNAMDELGGVNNVEPEGYETMFIIQGKGVQDSFNNRRNIFCVDEPRFTTEGVNVHPGAVPLMFYRGVRARDTEKNALFTYNFQGDHTLTEDRTLKYEFQQRDSLSRNLPTIPNKRFAEKLIRSRGYYEENLDFLMCGDPSDEFLDAVEDAIHDMTISYTARALLQRERPQEIPEAESTPDDRKAISDAIALAQRLGAKLRPEDIKLVDNLGGGVVAACKNREILISKRAVANGTDYLAITLYEEWVHRDLGYADETRGMQQHLFDKILELVKEIDRAEVS